MQKLQPTKITALLTKLTKGKNVSLRDLENVLGLDAVAEYERLWAAEQDRRKFFENKPTALAEYEAMLKRADLLTARADKALTVNSAKNLRVLANAEYDAALAHIKQYVAENEDGKVWLDRDAFGTLGQARLVTSRSTQKLTEGANAKVSKEDIKRTVLQNALDKIAAEQKAFSESADGMAMRTKLKELMAKLNKQSRGGGYT